MLVDRFLDDAIEIDVDALFDGEDLYLGGVMEHIEEAGIHSGDSSCALPPITLGAQDLDAVAAGAAEDPAGAGNGLGAFLERREQPGSVPIGRNRAAAAHERRQGNRDRHALGGPVRVQQSRGDGADLVHVAHDQEVVAADVAHAHPRQPPGKVGEGFAQGADQIVSRGETGVVVDRLERVDVQPRRHELLAARDPAFDVARRRFAARQPGERAERDRLLDLRLGDPAHHLGHQHDAETAPGRVDHHDVVAGAAPVGVGDQFEEFQRARASLDQVRFVRQPRGGPLRVQGVSVRTGDGDEESRPVD